MLKYYIDFVGKDAEQLLEDSALCGRVVQHSTPIIKLKMNRVAGLLPIAQVASARDASG
jgi:hypothetical protein